MPILERILGFLERLIYRPSPRFVGGKLLNIVKDTAANQNFEVKGTGVDAKGAAVPDDELSIVVTSDNPGSVAVTQDTTNPRVGQIAFGVPGQANITANVTRKDDGTLLAAFGAQFTVTAGEPSAIQGGEIDFTEVPAAQPAPTVDPTTTQAATANP